MSDSMFSILDIIVLLVGVYAFYSCYLMKTTGEVKTKLVLSDHTDINKCKDKKGFIDYMFLKLLILGIVSVVYGVVGLIDTYVTPLGIAQLVLMLVFIIYLIWFALKSKKAVTMFW